MKTKNKDIMLYITTAYMVFLSIYTLGLRISLWATGWDMIYSWCRVFYLYGISILGCGVLGILLIIKGRKIILKPDVLLLAGLILWLCISAVFNSDLGLKENISGVADIAVTVVAFYLVGRIYGGDKLIFILKRVMLFAIPVWSVGCIVSLGMYLSNYNGYYKFNGFLRASRQGIMEGRLFGCFSDPNYAAMISCLLIAVMVYMLRLDFLKNRKGFVGAALRVYFKTGIGLSALYIALSGSRSTLVAMTVTCVVTMFVYTFKKRADGEEKDRFGAIKGNALWVYFSRIFAACFLLIAVNYAALYGMQGVGYLVAPDRDMSVEFERDDVTAENISNSRFQIWMDYMTLVKDRPVTGLSSRGALVYARRLDPTSYLSTMGYNPHSMFVQMCVQGGIVGILIMLAFLIRAFVQIVKLIRTKKISAYTILMIALICIHGVYCVFNVGIFITPCVEAMLAWVALGSLEKSSIEAADEKSGGEKA